MSTIFLGHRTTYFEVTVSSREIETYQSLLLKVIKTELFYLLFVSFHVEA